MNISIIIPTKNRADLLRQSLGRLVKQLRHGDEIIVVDNGSSDLTKDVIKKFTTKYDIKYILENRKGPSFARNKAINTAKGEILAFLDDDCYVSNDWLNKMESTIVKDKNASVFQGKIVNEFSERNSSYKNYFNLKNRIAFYEIKNTAKWKKGKFIDFLNAGNFFLLKTTLGSNCFDSTLFPFIGEERDLAYRLQLEGKKIIFVPDVYVYHQKKNKSILSHFKTTFLYGRAQGILEKKYLTNNYVRKLFNMDKLTVKNHIQDPIWTSFPGFFYYVTMRPIYNLGKLYGNLLFILRFRFSN